MTTTTEKKVGYTDLIKACESAWSAMQERNPELPDAVILVASGGRRAKNLYGHFLREGWEHEDGDKIHEVMIVAEQLKRSPEDIFTTLMHEATHALAFARDIKDVSGRYHNKRFVMVAEELGMVSPESSLPQIGWSAVKLSDETVEAYREHIDNIGKELNLCRSFQSSGAKKGKTTWVFGCECGRKLRLGKKAIQDYADWDNVMIDCGICGSEFQLEEDI